MDTGAVKEALTRKIGPLPVVAWAGIGVGAFLVVRRLSGGGASSGFTASTGSGTDFEDTGTGGGSSGGTPATPPATPPPTTKPSLWGSDIPKTISLVFSSASAKRLFDKYGIRYGTKINMSDLRTLLQRMKINFGTSIDAGDLVKAGIAKTTTTAATAIPVVGVPDYNTGLVRPAATFAQNTVSSTAPTIDSGDIRSIQVGRLPASLT